MDIGKKITELRKRMDWSSRKLALTVGMSTGYLADIERGDKQPTIEMLQKICKSLNISLSQFFSENPEHPYYILELLNAIDGLTANQIEILKLVAKEFKKEGEKCESI